MVWWIFASLLFFQNGCFAVQWLQKKFASVIVEKHCTIRHPSTSGACSATIRVGARQAETVSWLVLTLALID
jgi:hypothetical protein